MKSEINLLLHKKTILFLFLIIILAFSLRVYKLDQVPASISWDEAAVGYNSFTIGSYGRDEYGSFLPSYFRSFGEDKQPVHIYITALFVKFLGLSEFSIRLPVAIFGVLNALLIFYLVKEMFKHEAVALISSLFFSISPQNIFFSRFNHESNFALFFLLTGLLLFFKAIHKKIELLPFSLMAFFLSMISYHAAEIIVPLIVLFLVILYFKKILVNKTVFFISLFIIIAMGMFSLINPNLLGINRFNQTVQRKDKIEETEIFQKTHNLFLGRISLALTQYSWHFDPHYLFISGDENARLAPGGFGEFYKIDLIFLITGVLYLLYQRTKVATLVLSWALIAPLPSALFAEAPHAGRAVFMTGSWHIIAAFGLIAILNLFRNKYLKRIVIFIFALLLTFSLLSFTELYFNNFPKKSGIEWQYGMKQIVEFVKNNPTYDRVYMTDVRAQPYIFFLFYLREPLPEYLNTGILNNSPTSNYSNVSFFGKYSFGGWDVLESKPEKGVLYIVSPSEYDGLRYRSEFDVKKIVYFLDGGTAFYIIGAKI